MDLLTTGIDVPEITTLVFMRRVKSRILFEQMMGRATRLCPDIHKNHFEIYDPVGVYDSLEAVNTMKPVVVNPATTFPQLLEGLELLVNKVFGEQLESVILELNEYLYDDGGKLMETVYTLKVYPQGRGTSVYRVLKISGNKTLDDLCIMILGSFGFDCGHLYEFCMDNKMYGRNSYQSDPEGRQPSTKIKIGKIGLREKQKFSLHYDFGDDWMFTINVQNIQEDTGVKEPYIVKGKGNIEQYPDWDDEWE